MQRHNDQQYRDRLSPVNEGDEEAAESDAELLARIQEESRQLEDLRRRVKAQQAQAIPAIVTEDFVKRIAERLSWKITGEMPQPGLEGAPITFTGASSKPLPEFFDRFEACLEEANITDPRQKHRIFMANITS